MHKDTPPSSEEALDLLDLPQVNTLREILESVDLEKLQSELEASIGDSCLRTATSSIGYDDMT